VLWNPPTVKEYVEKRQAASAGDIKQAQPVEAPAAPSITNLRASDVDPNWPRLTAAEDDAARGYAPWYYPVVVTNGPADGVWERKFENLGRDARNKLFDVYREVAKLGAMSSQNPTDDTIDAQEEQFEVVLAAYDTYVKSLIAIEKAKATYFGMGYWFAGVYVLAVMEKLNTKLPLINSLSSPYYKDLAQAINETGNAAGDQLKRSDRAITALIWTERALLVAEVAIPIAAGAKVIARKALTEALEKGVESAAAKQAARKAAARFVAVEVGKFVAGQAAVAAVLPPVIRALGLNEHQVAMGLAIVQSFTIVRQIKTGAPGITTKITLPEPSAPRLQAKVAKNNLSGALLEKVKQVENRLLELRDIAADNIASGQAPGGKAKELANVPANSSDYARAYGAGIHEEFSRLIKVDQATGKLPKEMKSESGVADPEFGFLKRFSGKKPDVRLALGKGLEAIWDLTSIAEANKSARGHAGTRYWLFDFAVYIADLPYRR
jgi:hypothetical protein